MRTIRRNRALVAALPAWGVGGVFIYAALVKLAEPAAFVEAVAGYRLLPTWMEAPAAFSVAWLELVAGAGLLIPRLRPAASALLSALLAVFIAALASAWWRGLNVECGCFGGTGATTGYAWPIVRDLGLLAAVLLCALGCRPGPLWTAARRKIAAFPGSPFRLEGATGKMAPARGRVTE